MLSKNRTYDTDIFFPGEKTEQDKTGRVDPEPPVRNTVWGNPPGNRGGKPRAARPPEARDETKRRKNQSIGPTPTTNRPTNGKELDVHDIVHELYRCLGEIQRDCVNTYPEIESSLVETKPGYAVEERSSRYSTPVPSENESGYPEVQPTSIDWSFQIPVLFSERDGASRVWVENYQLFAGNAMTDVKELHEHYLAMIAAFRTILIARKNFCTLLRTGLVTHGYRIEDVNRVSHEIDRLELQLATVLTSFSADMRKYYPDFMRMAKVVLESTHESIAVDLSERHAFIFEFTGLIGRQESLNALFACIKTWYPVFKTEYDLLNHLGFYRIRTAASFLGVKVVYQENPAFGDFRQRVLNSLVGLVYTWQTMDTLNATPAPKQGESIPDQAGSGQGGQDKPDAKTSEQTDNTGPESPSDQDRWFETTTWDVEPGQRGRESPALQPDDRNEQSGDERYEENLKKQIAVNTRRIKILKELHESIMEHMVAKEVVLSRAENDPKPAEDASQHLKDIHENRIKRAKVSLTRTKQTLKDNLRETLDKLLETCRLFLLHDGYLQESLRSGKDMGDVMQELGECENKMRLIQQDIRDTTDQLSRLENPEGKDSEQEVFRDERMAAMGTDIKEFLDNEALRAKSEIKLMQAVEAAKDDPSGLRRVFDGKTARELDNLRESEISALGALLDEHYLGVPVSARARLRDLQRDHPELYKAWLRASTGAKPTSRHAAYTSPEP